MKQYWLTLQKDKENIGYVQVNIYKPFDKEIDEKNIIQILENHMEKEVFKTIDK